MAELVARTRQAIPWAVAQARTRQSSPRFYGTALSYAENRFKEVERTGDPAKIQRAQEDLLIAKNYPERDRQVINFLQEVLAGELPEDWNAKPKWHYYPCEGIYKHNILRIPSLLQSAKEEKVDLKEIVSNVPAVGDVPQEVFEEIYKETLEQYREIEKEEKTKEN